MTHPKKLIEVSLPLDVINDVSAYDKMPGIGPHPKGIHHWWARLPLPTARAVLFASVVNDPETDPRFAGASAEEIEEERERLHGIIRRMMQARLHEKPEVYEEARAEMAKHCEGQLPTVLDPFSGGGSIPLEAQRLGFPAVASDLNPVAVMINKAQLEIVPRWLDHPPVNPDDAAQIQGSWQGATGLAKDVAWYGEQVRQKAIKEIGQLYPKVKLPKDLGGLEAEVIAWIWARTVRSPDPAAGGAHVPLISTYWLCSKKGKEAYLEPIVDTENKTYRFAVRYGKPKQPKEVSAGTKIGKGVFKCILTDTTIPSSYSRQEGKADQIRMIPLAIVADGGRKRVYVECTPELIPDIPEYQAAPDQELPEKALGFRIQGYGINQYKKMFHPRQLYTIGFLCDAIAENRGRVLADAKKAGLSKAQAEEYAKAVTTFLAFAVDRCADFNNSLCRWAATNEKPMNLFGRQAIPMVWDFAEGNLLGTSVGSYQTCMEYVAKCMQTITRRKDDVSRTQQQDAVAAVNSVEGPLLVSTDPPYYDNIGYAALSDFFYVWLRKNLMSLYPEVFSTVLVPKGPELTAAAERHDGDKQAAKEHFENGFRQAFTNLRARMDPRFPLTVYYAFKQSDEEAGAEEEDEDERVTLTTGWETLLEALNASGFQITATVPVRASQQWRMRAMGSNALASYIVLACRPRSPEAPTASRRDFLRDLRQRLPSAVDTLQKANIAPVDLAQAALGPGMAVFSSFGRVLENEGGEMSVRAALRVINQVLSECLEEQESEFDPDTRWAVAWFRQYGYEAGPFGDAEGLARAQAVSVKGLQDGGILHSSASKVRLLKPDELPQNWNPATDKRLSLWEATGHLTRALKQGGEAGAARVLRELRAVNAGMAEACRELAYLLFQISESKRWPAEALPFNALVVSWPSILNQINDLPPVSKQSELDLV